MANKKISAAPSIKRLPSYLNLVKQSYEDGDEYISGTYIAKELKLAPIQVRKDLALTGITGKPKMGYPVEPLIEAIEHFLAWDDRKNAVIVGAGSLATALTGYPEFAAHGLHFAGAFDVAKEKIGKSIHGVPVYPLSTLSQKVKELNATVAILTVPSSHAQGCADLIAAAGIKAIWNFTNQKLSLPDDVIVQKEDLTSGYAMLCVRMGD